MNTKNNRRRRESVEKMEKAFVQFLQQKELNRISVSEICEMAQVNRSTFYANYMDIYDLADQMRAKLETEFSDLFSGHDAATEGSGALRMFTHIRDNQLFYQTYFRLCYDEKHALYAVDEKRAEAEFGSKNLKYHVEFFRNGINAIIQLWMAGGCQESPEEMAEVLRQEYRGR